MGESCKIEFTYHQQLSSKIRQNDLCPIQSQEQLATRCAAVDEMRKTPAIKLTVTHNPYH